MGHDVTQNQLRIWGCLRMMQIVSQGFPSPKVRHWFWMVMRSPQICACWNFPTSVYWFGAWRIHNYMSYEHVICKKNPLTWCSQCRFAISNGKILLNICEALLSKISHMHRWKLWEVTVDGLQLKGAVSISGQGTLTGDPWFHQWRDGT